MLATSLTMRRQRGFKLRKHKRVTSRCSESRVDWCRKQTVLGVRSSQVFCMITYLGGPSAAAAPHAAQSATSATTIARHARSRRQRMTHCSRPWAACTGQQPNPRPEQPPPPAPPLEG
ncbi:TPA: hypothetical protein ACH3X3_009892 [Trebouxia sp. C0006]